VGEVSVVFQRSSPSTHLSAAWTLKHAGLDAFEPVEPLTTGA
jgi:hypothetical protein